MPVEGTATTPATSAAATTASTAFPPASSTACPARAPSAWPVTSPLPSGSAAGASRVPAKAVPARPRKCRRSSVGVMAASESSAGQREPAAVDLVPVEELQKLPHVLGLSVLVIDVEGVLVHVADDERLAEPDDADFV